MTDPAIVADEAALLALIGREVAQILRDKGEQPRPVTAETVFLEGTLPFDSLDLATLVVALESATGCDPFRQGFRQFTTAGELARLYADALAVQPLGFTRGEGA